MKNGKPVRIILLLLSIITGTVAPMEQPDPQQAKAGWGQWFKGSFSTVNSTMKNLFYYRNDQANDEWWTAPEAGQETVQKAIDENKQTVVELGQENRQAELVAADNHADITRLAAANRPEGQNAYLPVQPQVPDHVKEQLPPSLSDPDFQQQNTPSEPVQKSLAASKPVLLYCTLGGSSLALCAALVYKAIDYMQLNCVKNNLRSLDDLIDAAHQNNDANRLKDLYEIKKADLTLLVDAEKGLLLHLLPEKEKFAQAATNLKHGLVESAKKSLFSRISYGIKHDVKRAQGWSVRAGNAIKQKLNKFFRSGK